MEKKIIIRIILVITEITIIETIIFEFETWCIYLAFLSKQHFVTENCLKSPHKNIIKYKYVSSCNNNPFNSIILGDLFGDRLTPNSNPPIKIRLNAKP